MDIVLDEAELEAAGEMAAIRFSALAQTRLDARVLTRLLRIYTLRSKSLSVTMLHRVVF